MWFNTWELTWVVRNSFHLVLQHSPAKTSQTCVQDSTPVFPTWAQNCTHRRSCNTEDVNETLAKRLWTEFEPHAQACSKQDKAGAQLATTHLEVTSLQSMRTVPCLRVQDFKNNERQQKKHTVPSTPTHNFWRRKKRKKKKQKLKPHNHICEFNWLGCLFSRF